MAQETIEPKPRRHSLPRIALDTPISKVMNPHVVAIEASMSVETLTAIFLDRAISGAPVVDAEYRPIGIVSKTDLLRAHFERSNTAEIDPWKIEGSRDREALDVGMRIEHLHELSVSDVMMPMAFTLPNTAPISQAAALMSYEGVHRIPVTDADGRLTGIVSTIDILRWLGRRAGYIVPRYTQAQRAP